jgi:type IV secretory pathway VirB4 component
LRKFNVAVVFATQSLADIVFRHGILTPLPG